MMELKIVNNLKFNLILKFRMYTKISKTAVSYHFKTKNKES